MDELPVFANAAQAARRLDLTPRMIPFLQERGFLHPAAIDAEGHPLYAIADVVALKALRAECPPKRGYPAGRPRAPWKVTTA